MSVEIRWIAKHLKTVKGVRCNCDLDNWEPEQSSGHSCVCRIHKLAHARFNRCGANYKQGHLDKG